MIELSNAIDNWGDTANAGKYCVMYHTIQWGLPQFSNALENPLQRSVSGCILRTASKGGFLVNLRPHEYNTFGPGTSLSFLASTLEGSRRGCRGFSLLRSSDHDST